MLARAIALSRTRQTNVITAFKRTSTSVMGHSDSMPTSTPTQVPSSRRHLSTPSTSNNESKGIFDRIRDTMDERSKRKQADQYAQQMLKMAESEHWDLKTFSDQIESSLGGWRSKIPGLSNVQAIKNIKESQKVIGAAMDVLGDHATAEDLKNIGKKEKLKISLKCGAELSDINVLIQQFQSMEIMHRILRYRKLNNKSIPTDEESAKTILQADAGKVMTSQEKKQIQKIRSKKGMRSMRR